MDRVSYSDLRNNLAKYMDEVCDNRAPLVVTRQNARSVVMLSEDEFSGMMETLHLLRNPQNAAHLLRGLKEAAAGEMIERPLKRAKR